MFSHRPPYTECGPAQKEQRGFISIFSYKKPLLSEWPPNLENSLFMAQTCHKNVINEPFTFSNGIMFLYYCIILWYFTFIPSHFLLEDMPKSLAFSFPVKNLSYMTWFIILSQKSKDRSLLKKMGYAVNSLGYNNDSGTRLVVQNLILIFLSKL